MIYMLHLYLQEWGNNVTLLIRTHDKSEIHEMISKILIGKIL